MPLNPIQSPFGSGDGAVDGERIVKSEASVRARAAQVDAQLLDDVTADFGDRDAQADLIGAANREGVDDPSAGRVGLTARAATRAVAAARTVRDGYCGALRGGCGVIDEAVRDVERLLSLLGRRDGPGEDDRVLDRAHVNFVAGEGGVEQVQQFGDGAPDRDLEDRDPPPVLAQGEDARLAIGDGGNIDALRRAHDRVGDSGIANVDLARLIGQIDDDGLADTQLQVLGRRV